MVTIFIEILNIKLIIQLQIQCCTTFEDAIEKGVFIDKTLVAKGLVKIFKETPNAPSDKGIFWSQNKNVTNDGVVKAKVVNQEHLTNHLKVSFTSNTPTPNHEQTMNVVQNNQQRRGPSQVNMPKRTYTPSGEPIESILKKILQSNDIQLLDIKTYELALVKLNWWNENEFCENHHGK